KLGGDALDGALDSERLVAADAPERFLLFEHARRCVDRAKVQLRPKADDLLRTGRLAQSALHAGVLRKTQHRPLAIIAQCTGRASGDAGEAQRATLGIDLDR